MRTLQKEHREQAQCKDSRERKECTYICVCVCLCVCVCVCVFVCVCLCVCVCVKSPLRGSSENFSACLKKIFYYNFLIN